MSRTDPDVAPIPFVTYLVGFVLGLVLFFMNWMVVVFAASMIRETPILALVFGWPLQSDAPWELAFASHLARSWVPILVGYLVAFGIAGRRIRHRGMLVFCGAYVFWSFAIFHAIRWTGLLEVFGLVGLLGALVGGAVLYYRYVEPRDV